jgi:zinc protease
MYVVVGGDINPQLVAEALDGFLADWPTPTKAGTARVTIPEPPQAIAQPVKLREIQPTAQQTHLGIAFLAPGLGDPDQAALEVLDSYLSGLGGLLFNELRNKRSLAYTVASFYNPGLKTGAFNFYIATDPQKTGEATQGILNIIKDLRVNALTNDQVQSAIKYLLGLKLISHQTLSSRADEYMYNVLYDLGPDFDQRHIVEIEAVTPQDVLRAAQKYLDPQTAVISTVGQEPSTQAAFDSWVPTAPAPSAQ